MHKLRWLAVWAVVTFALGAEAQVPAADKAAAEARERANAHRESEEMMRTAAASYDPAAYRRGQQLLTAAAIGTFLLFTLLIVF